MRFIGPTDFMNQLCGRDMKIRLEISNIRNSLIYSPNPLTIIPIHCHEICRWSAKPLNRSPNGLEAKSYFDHLLPLICILNNMAYLTSKDDRS